MEKKEKRKSKNEYILFKEVSKVGLNDEWDEIKKEWNLESVRIENEPHTCLCGKYPILEICTLLNKNNKEEIEVGNSCVNKFLGIDSDSVIKGVKKIKEDILNSVPKKLIEKCYKNKTINDWEYNFYINILRKRNLSTNQENCKRKINKKIYNKYINK